MRGVPQCGWFCQFRALGAVPLRLASVHDGRESQPFTQGGGGPDQLVDGNLLGARPSGAGVSWYRFHALFGQESLGSRSEVTPFRMLRAED